MADAQKKVTVNILNHLGDESQELLMAEAMALLDKQLKAGNWVFDDSTNNMLTDSTQVKNAMLNGDSFTAMPASVGG